MGSWAVLKIWLNQLHHPDIHRATDYVVAPVKIKEALIESTCADLRQKFSLAKKNPGILTDFKFSDADQREFMA